MNLRRIAWLALLLVILIIAFPAVRVAGDTTPAVSSYVSFDGESINLTILAVSKNDVRYRDISVLVVPPDHSPLLVDFPRNTTRCNTTLVLALRESSTLGPDGQPSCLKAGDSISLSDSPGLSPGIWRLYLVYIPLGYAMCGVTWSIGSDAIGHSILTTAPTADSNLDPLEYYGFKPLTSDEAMTVAIILIGAISGVAAILFVTRSREPK